MSRKLRGTFFCSETYVNSSSSFVSAHSNQLCHVGNQESRTLVLFKEFEGNNDRFSIVSHKLENPIIAHYIRINPLEYHVWISLRADFYGCKSGAEK